MTRTRRCRTFLHGLGLLALACGGTEVDSIDVDALRSQWRDRAPALYVVKQCGTGLAPPLCVVSAVEDRAPIESRMQGFDGSWEALDDPIDPIERTLDSLAQPAGCAVSVAVDPGYGYVRDAYFDCGEEGHGSEVECFAAGTLDLEQCL